MEKTNTLRRFASWLVAGERQQIEKLIGKPIAPNHARFWYTPEYLFHAAGNAVLIGFYMPVIAWCIMLATR
jgi:hypothetical protein